MTVYVAFSDNTMRKIDAVVERFEIRDERAKKEAKQSREEDTVEPLRFFTPLKATTGYHAGEVFSLEQVMSWFNEKDYPIYCEKKYDGLRIIWMKEGDTVIARTDDGTRCDDRFPTLVKILKDLPVKSVTLDSEVEGWSDGEHWGREITAGYARAHEQPAEDSSFVANVFDVLYIEGLPKHHEVDVEGDLHNLPYAVRRRVLDYLGSLAGWQKTDQIPKTPAFNIVPFYVVEKPDIKKFQNVLDEILALPGSEGAMIKSAKSTYPLTGLTSLWLKYKKSADVHAIIIERIETKKPGIYTYKIGLLLPSDWDAPEDEIFELTLKNGKKAKILYAGKTFNTDKKLEPSDIVTMVFHTLFVYDDGRVRLYEPKLYEYRPDQIIPDSVDDAIRIARQAGLLREKKSLSIKTRYMMQFHFRGGSVHADLRIEKPDRSALQGWTLAIQEEEGFEEEVMKHWKVEKDGDLRKVYWDDELYYVYDMRADEVKEWNKLLDKFIFRWHKKATFNHPEWWKIDLKTGEPKEREPGVGIEAEKVEKIWATPKKDEPLEWLEVEGVFPPREIEPVPGGTRFWSGIFVEIDRGTVEYGAQKPYYREYFFNGKVLKGRYVFRLVNTDGKLQWLFWKTDDDMPYVISKRAVETGWMPELGVSALPSSWEKKVPKDLRWWEARTKDEAKKRRDEYVKSMLSKSRWLFQYQWWRGPIIIRRGPSRELWFLRVIKPDGVIEVKMTGDPRRSTVPGTITETEYDEFWDIGINEIVEVPPNTVYNESKNTPSWLMTLDSGKAEILQYEPLVVKINLDSETSFFATRSTPEEEIWECRFDYAKPKEVNE